MPDTPTQSSLREAHGILTRLAGLEASVQRLTDRFDAAEKQRVEDDTARAIREAEERGRVKALADAGLPDPTTSGGVQSPLVGTTAGATLAVWWSEHVRAWHLLVALGFIVGGQAVVLPFAERMAEAYLPESPSTLPAPAPEPVPALPDMGPELPPFDGPRDDSPVEPRPAL